MGCPSESIDISSDLIESILKINDKDIKITRVGHSECPSTQLRMIGDKNVDRLLFKSSNLCDGDKRYNEYNKNYLFLEKLFSYDNSFKFYTIYKRDNCDNQKNLNLNINKYKDQIIAKTQNINEFIPSVSFWILKHKSYFYIIGETNGLQGHMNHKAKESFLFYKKFKINELMLYDNGHYWNIITKYNIKID